MTNLEWIRTLSAKELSDLLYDYWLPRGQYVWTDSRKGLVKMLGETYLERDCDKCKHQGNCYCVKELGCPFEPKDEPTISKMEQVDKDINVSSKDEQTDCTEALTLLWIKNMVTDEEFYRIDARLKCISCEWWNDTIIGGSECVSKDCTYQPKDEPQTERSACDTCQWYNSGIPCGIEPSVCKREVTDTPQTDYDKGLQPFADILFDKEKSEQFLEECKAMGIEPQTEREGK